VQQALGLRTGTAPHPGEVCTQSAHTAATRELLDARGQLVHVNQREAGPVEQRSTGQLRDDPEGVHDRSGHRGNPHAIDDHDVFD